jgi:hypothetical protein
MSCIYAHCKQGGACMYPRSDGSRCSLIEPAPSPQPEMPWPEGYVYADPATGEPAGSPPEMPQGWECTADSNGPVFHSPEENPERSYRVRWWAVHHESLYVEGYDYALTVPLPVLRALLATQGLTIVGPAERAVLDECATEGGLVEWGDRVWRAERARRELARRAAREQKGEGNG